MKHVSPHAPPSRFGALVLYGHLLVGLIAVGFLAGTYALLGMMPDGPLLGLAFLGTFAVYQVERGLLPGPEDALNQPERSAWMWRHRKVVVGSIVLALLGGVALVPLLAPATWLACAGLGLLSMAYMIPVGRNRWRLKAVWFLKPVVIAGAWAVGGVLVPVWEAGRVVSGALLLLALARFGFVLPNALLADWPDRTGDAGVGLHTVATRFDEGTLRRLATGVLLAAVAVEGVALSLLHVPPIGYVDVAGPLLLLILVRRRPWPSARRFYTLWLDLVMAWPAVTAVAVALR